VVLERVIDTFVLNVQLVLVVPAINDRVGLTDLHVARLLCLLWPSIVYTMSALQVSVFPLHNFMLL